MRLRAERLGPFRTRSSCLPTTDALARSSTRSRRPAPSSWWSTRCRRWPSATSPGLRGASPRSGRAPRCLAGLAQAHRRRRRPRRARDQAGNPCGTTFARASGRHGSHGRRRPTPRSADGQGGQAQVRPDRGARPLRDGRAWARGGLGPLPDAPRRPASRARPGSAVLPTVEGERAIVVELQALVSPVRIGRAPGGLCADSSRAGSDCFWRSWSRDAESGFGRSDVFCSVAGGMRVAEPAADLPMAMAIVSAVVGVPGARGPGRIRRGRPLRRGPAGAALAAKDAQKPMRARVSATPSVPSIDAGLPAGDGARSGSTRSLRRQAEPRPAIEIGPVSRSKGAGA